MTRPDAETAARWAQAVTPHVAVVKVGLELFCRTGPSIVQSVRGASGTGLFLDLKLHDIPNTVAGAARSVFAARSQQSPDRWAASTAPAGERSPH